MPTKDEACGALNRVEGRLRERCADGALIRVEGSHEVWVRVEAREIQLLVLARGENAVILELATQCELLAHLDVKTRRDEARPSTQWAP